METTPRFINGVFSFTGSGLENAAPIGTGVAYVVPGDKRSQLIYFRGGNSSDAMIAVVLVRDGKPMRIFPIGAKASIHVPLAVVEDLDPESVVELKIAAPAGVAGQVVLDIGLIEI